MKDLRVQALFKRFRLSNISIFQISRDFYVLREKTVRANVNIYHKFN